MKERWCQRKKPRGEKKKRSGLFIFWIDRSDGMEPCVRNEGSCAFGKNFLGAHMLLIPSYTQYTCRLTYTHTAHMEGRDLHGQVRVSFSISSVLQAWMSSVTDFSFILSLGGFSQGSSV